MLKVVFLLMLVRLAYLGLSPKAVPYHTIPAGQASMERSEEIMVPLVAGETRGILVERLMPTLLATSPMGRNVEKVADVSFLCSCLIYHFLSSHLQQRCPGS